MSTDNIGLSFIRTDGGTQARAGLDEATVIEYMDAMRDGAEFPPVVLFYDGTDYWLGDGFHRVEARRRLKDEGQGGIIAVDLRQGTRRDAVLFAAQANASHGLRRSADDKRRAVMCLLNDEEWGKWSDREIARRCHVSPTLVGKLRGEVVTVHVDSEPVERTYITKHGNTATMQTANIGNGGTVYESIHSLQNAVLAYHKRVCVDKQDMIAALVHLKENRKSSSWGALSLDLGRNGKIFRNNDLRQAVNNALDSLQQTERAAADGNNLVDLVIEYATGYKDRFGRDWTQVENPAHTNGTFWDLIKAQSYLKKAYRNDAELKIAIKKAFARMKGEPEPDLSYWTKFVPTDEPEPVAAADEPYFPTLPKAAPQPPGEKNTIEARLFSALHCYDDSEERWQEHRDKGLTNDEMRAAIGREFGDGHGASGPGLVPFYAKGRANPQFWHNAHGSTAEKPTLQGVALIDLARQVLGIPFPQPATEPVAAAPVLNEEQTKPRIASFVMGYFQAANEAIARITTAIPKARADDIHDMLTIVASLERMEQRIGAEYDMS